MIAGWPLRLPSVQAPDQLAFTVSFGVAVQIVDTIWQLTRSNLLDEVSRCTGNPCPVLPPLVGVFVTRAAGTSCI